MTRILQASPAKLRDGSWGARVVGEAREGDTIRITTRSGRSWAAVVTRVLWTGTRTAGPRGETQAVSIVTDEPVGAPPPIARSGRRYAEESAILNRFGDRVGGAR